MKLECKAYSTFCELEIFKINNIDATYNDFGIKDDLNPEQAIPYGCKNMRFVAKRPTQEVLDKYHITKEEYYTICVKLNDELSFGECAWCR